MFLLISSNPVYLNFLWQQQSLQLSFTVTQKKIYYFSICFVLIQGESLKSIIQFIFKKNPEWQFLIGGFGPFTFDIITAIFQLKTITLLLAICHFCFYFLFSSFVPFLASPNFFGHFNFYSISLSVTVFYYYFSGYFRDYNMHSLLPSTIIWYS